MPPQQQQHQEQEQLQPPAGALTVGALWKRGLAMAGAVGGAAVEVAAGKAPAASRTPTLQDQHQQRWPSAVTAAASDSSSRIGTQGFGGRQARQGYADSGSSSAFAAGFAGGVGAIVGGSRGEGRRRGSVGTALTAQVSVAIVRVCRGL